MMASFVHDNGCGDTILNFAPFVPSLHERDGDVPLCLQLHTPLLQENRQILSDGDDNVFTNFLNYFNCMRQCLIDNVCYYRS